MNLKEFINKYEFEIDFWMVDKNPHLIEPWDAYHYQIEITNSKDRRKRFGLFFSMGKAICKDPDLYSVFECLALDANIIHVKDFREWATDFGFDTDSLKALKGYQTTLMQTKKLKSFLGENIFNELMECEV